ncbi:ATP-binding protein [Caldimonas tepidiphila]|uniref:ATP-binding protein n=1 Tax=Caldimonas tepidiphila TaxID=2315841 RepID=UPI000E5BBA92|nr:YhaN family protein [Caldimonas tepidiphila]
MKLVRLFLKAFGPFTERVLDLSASPAGLHLVYGPNEAGKSSALRAMGDLRFGIPMRSADSFVHPYERMRVGGAFVGGDGRLLGLMRHKGRLDTLSRCCPESGEALGGGRVSPDDEAALTGRLSRAEFEAMFGLDHARLRQGGRELIAGRGELGAALFAASAGAQGVNALLESIEAEAKRFYSPRASTAAINEARRQIEDARQACRAALTKPAQWKQLQRAHELAGEELAQSEQALAALRQRLAGLGELRTVAPLLRELALREADCAALADAPDLPPDACGQRERAEDALARAQSDARLAAGQLQAAQAVLDALTVEDRVLELAAMVERLLAMREQVEQGRAELQQLQAALAHAQDDFALRAARIAPGTAPQLLLAAAPSRADEAALQQQLDALAQLDARLQLLREQQARLDAELRADEAARPMPPEPQRLPRLDEALAAARALGELPARQAAAQQRREQLAERLRRALHDLGLGEPAALAGVRPLLDAQIDAADRAAETLAQARRTLEDEQLNLRRDEAAQQLRLRTLQAGGEVATAASLRDARRRRDEGWQLVKQVGGPEDASAGLRDRVACWAAGLPLPAAFEAAMAEADRQADLLQRDAERAAKVEECGVRIEQMGARLAGIAAQLDENAARARARDEDWQRLLREHALPALAPQALRQWQARCDAARELAQQLAEAGQAEHELHEAARQAREALCAVLPGEAPSPQTPWPALLARGAEQARALREQESRSAAFDAEQRRLRREREAGAKAIAELEARRREPLEALSRWHARLLLPAGSSAAAVQARAQELMALAALHDETASRRVRRDALQAQAEALGAMAADLAGLLGEAPPPHVGAFADRLAQRLAAARAAAQQRALSMQDRESARSALARAETLAAQQEATLAALCEAAGGVARDGLAAVQARAQRKAQAGDELERLRRQIALASDQPREELARRLAGLDVAALEQQRAQCLEAIERQEAALKAAAGREREARAALDAVDGSGEAAAQREALELAAARLRSAVRPWARLKLAGALLHEAQRRFRERAQGPMLGEASRYFEQMTAGRYTRLVVDEREQGPVLLAEREDGRRVALDAMSEGTADQLYLALRLAAQAVRSDHGAAGRFAMPLVLDDVLMTSDDERAQQILRALLAFSAHAQVLLFTHHRHLHELAAASFHEREVALHRL